MRISNIAAQKIFHDKPTLYLINMYPSHAKSIIRLACLKEYAATKDIRFTKGIFLSKGNVLYRFEKFIRKIEFFHQNNNSRY